MKKSVKKKKKLKIAKRMKNYSKKLNHFIWPFF